MQCEKFNTKTAYFIVHLFAQISKELDSFSLSSEVKQAVLDCIWPRQEEVRRSLVLSTAAISNSYLKDFDWKVKVSGTVLKLL